jgi:orotate phosphoribosyltransferase
MAGVMQLLPARKGHFLLESGHHGELWLEMERLLVRPAPVRDLAKALAGRVARHGPEVVCGPLVEGAFVALMVAEDLGLPFCYTVSRRTGDDGHLFPTRYELPPALGSLVTGERVAVVNDIINAGSAVRGSLEAVRNAGGTPVLAASLAVLGVAAQRLAEEHGVALEALEQVPNAIWRPAECPLCRAGEPLSRIGG